MNQFSHPALESLRQGHWFKLIGGASFQHLPSLRELALVYSLAGADCIDVAADPAVIAAVQAGIAAAQHYRGQTAGIQPSSIPRPLLMISLNDGEDPHFRKAQFDPRHCPADCPRPCAAVCPAQAIPATQSVASQGVVESRCYGCGRCLPICPIGNIHAHAHVSAPAVAMEMAIAAGVEALEIHTQVGRLGEFQRLWRSVLPWLSALKLIAVSCSGQAGPQGESLEGYLPQLYDTMAPQLTALNLPLVWQTDGRPMSGDIGMGTTHAAIALAQRVLRLNLPGFVQLAGGTNGYTVSKLHALGLLSGGDQGDTEHLSSQACIAGVAYGSYGRSLLTPSLAQLEIRSGHLEDFPDLLEQALARAVSLVTPLKLTAPGNAGKKCQS